MNNRGLMVWTLFACASVGAARGARAANLASDNAADPAYNAGWTTGANGGSGFGAWSLSPVGSPPQFSYYIGSSASNGAAPPSGNVDASGKSWGLSNSIADACDATRTFTGGSLSVGQHVLVDMDNGPVAGAGFVELALRSGKNDRLEWLANASTGQTYVFSNQQSPGIISQVNTAIPFTSNGLHLDFSLTGADTFAVDATPAGGTTHHFTGTLEGTSAAGIDTVEFLNYAAGTGPSHDLFFNNLAVTPEPAGLALLALIAPLLVRRRRAVG